MELLIGREFLSYPSLIGQLKKDILLDIGYVSFLGFRVRTNEGAFAAGEFDLVVCLPCMWGKREVSLQEDV